MTQSSLDLLKFYQNFLKNVAMASGEASRMQEGMAVEYGGMEVPSGGA